MSEELEDLDLLQTNPNELLKIMAAVQPDPVKSKVIDQQFWNAIEIWDALFGRLVRTNTKPFTACNVVVFHLCDQRYSVKRIDGDAFKYPKELERLWQITKRMNDIKSFTEDFPAYQFNKERLNG